MKLTAWLLCLCFTMNVFASTGLSEAVDEYNYTLSVEWDQVDQAFHDARTKEFFAKVSSLMEEGMTQKEISDFVATKISDKALLNDLSLSAQNASSVQELMEVLKMNSANFYARGANWNGSTVLKVGTIAAISALFVYSVFFSVKYGCIQHENGVRSYCTDDNN